MNTRTAFPTVEAPGCSAPHESCLGLATIRQNQDADATNPRCISHRHRVGQRLAVNLALLCLLGPHQLRGASNYWTTPGGGAFAAPANWSAGGVPGPGDTVIFTNAGSHVLGIEGGATNTAATFQQGVVTAVMNQSTWQLISEMRIADSAGATARVAIVSGSVAITNPGGTGLLTVGRVGCGDLAIRGGSVFVDTLMATNGSLSTCSFDYGDLSTLRGSTFSLGSSASLVLGNVTNTTFVWNVLGGTNHIITGPFEYGGLTLGGGGRTTLNVKGPSTSLSVPGLDTTGGHAINIVSGGQLHTRSVQLGLGVGSTGNVVTISGPGSSWTNDYLIYFGMHAGGQTLIITNGGRFWTGGTSYQDQRFSALTGDGGLILITGSNSLFHSEGTAELAIEYCSPTPCPRHNLILITNGGNFWARQLRYGSAGTNPGTVIDVAEGSLYIGMLTFGAGRLQLESGTGVISQLIMTGGTNAVIQTNARLLTGNHGPIGPGDLQVGIATSTVSSLNGKLLLGGWGIGCLAGDTGVVTVVGGQVLVTNSTHNASLVIGDSGNGSLRMDGGSLFADASAISSAAGSTGALCLNSSAARFATRDLRIGPGGSVTVSNNATLRFESCTATSPAIMVSGGTLEFDILAPAFPSNVITATNATICFRGLDAAPLALDDPAFLGRIMRQGSMTLELINSTNLWTPLLDIRDGDPSAWSSIILAEGTSMVQAGSIIVESNSYLLATNATGIVAGSATMRGTISLYNSTLRFTSPATLTGTSCLEGSGGFVFFDGGLQLSAADVIVPTGISVSASSITSAGGRLVVQGGGIIPDANGFVPEWVQIVDGWVTYMDCASAPLTPPPGLLITGPPGLELIRSTNATSESSVFHGGGPGYQRLRLGPGGTWQAGELSIGQGGSLFVSDPSAAVVLSSGVFRVLSGGLFRDDTGGASLVGFSSTGSAAAASVTGIGSSWVTTSTLSVASSGSRNVLRVTGGGQILSGAGIIGGGRSNCVQVSDPGSAWRATDGISLQGLQSELLIHTGAAVVCAKLVENGSDVSVVIAGLGAQAAPSNQVLLAGFRSRMSVVQGGSLISSNFTINSYDACEMRVAGSGTVVRLTGNLSVAAPLFFQRTNTVMVEDGALLTASACTLSGSFFGRAGLLIQSGSVFITNSTKAATLNIGSCLELERGHLRADRVFASFYPYSQVRLQAGRAEWVASDFTTGLPLQVGSGSNMCILTLLGGTNICRSGVEIRPHGELTGRGTIIGAVTNRGMIAPDAITIAGNLALDARSTLAFTLRGPPSSASNSALAVTGVVSLAGALAIRQAEGWVASSNHTYILLDATTIISNFENVASGERLLTTDHLASFRIGIDTVKVFATDFRSEDLDGDGIRDAWALQYFGASPLLPGADQHQLDGDADGDGISNRDEFMLQTIPTDPDSGLELYVGLTAEGAPCVRFPLSPGRTYSLGSSTNLTRWNDNFLSEFQFDSNGDAIWPLSPSNTPPSAVYRLMCE